MWSAQGSCQISEHPPNGVHQKPSFGERCGGPSHTSQRRSHVPLVGWAGKNPDLATEQVDWSIPLEASITVPI